MSLRAKGKTPGGKEGEKGAEKKKEEEFKLEPITADVLKAKKLAAIQS